MAKPLLTDQLWERIESFIPSRSARPQGGRPPIPDRKCLTGILFVLRTGIPWEYLPQEMGCGSGMTCWRRLRDWQQAGVWDKIWRALLDELGEADEIDWSAGTLNVCDRAPRDQMSLAACQRRVRRPVKGSRNRMSGSRRIGHKNVRVTTLLTGA